MVISDRIFVAVSSVMAERQVFHMLLYKGKVLKNFMINETKDISNRRDFVSRLENDYILRENTRRGVFKFEDFNKQIVLLKSDRQ